MNSSQQFHYEQLDVTKIRDVLDFCARYSEKHDPKKGHEGLSALILSAGKN